MGLVWEACDKGGSHYWGSLESPWNHHAFLGNTWDIPWFQMTNMHPISWSRTTIMTMIREVFQWLFWVLKWCLFESSNFQKSLMKIFMLLLLLLLLLLLADRFELVSPRRREDRTWCPRLFLHCYRLRFKDMRWGVKLQMLNHELGEYSYTPNSILGW